MLSLGNLESRSAPKRARLFVLLALAPPLLLAAQSFAGPITVPTTLLPGAQYRLAFVTAGTRDASSTNIADYDAFVTAEANTEAALSSISWQVIGSTATVSARDHTGTAPSNYPGVPIFLLNDEKLVDDYAELWGTGIDTPLDTTQHADTSPLSEVWTGTIADGSPYVGRELGSTVAVEVGQTNLVNSLWVQIGPVNPANNFFPIYALSGVLAVPTPEPTTALLLTLDFAALLLVRRVRAG